MASSSVVSTRLLLYGGDDDDVAFKKVAKVKLVEMHPVHPWVACADVADDHYRRKYAARFADAGSPDVLARPPEAASCLPLCRTLLEAASSPRKAVDDLFSPANERAVRVTLRVTGSVAAVAAFASMF